jgi:hypothetical protein
LPFGTALPSILVEDYQNKEHKLRLAALRNGENTMAHPRSALKTLCTILLGAMAITGIGATGSSAATTGKDASASQADAQQKMRLACGGWGQPVCKPPATCGVRG